MTEETDTCAPDGGHSSAFFPEIPGAATSEQRTPFRDAPHSSVARGQGTFEHLRDEAVQEHAGYPKNARTRRRGRPLSPPPSRSRVPIIVFRVTSRCRTPSSGNPSDELLRSFAALDPRRHRSVPLFSRTTPPHATNASGALSLGASFHLHSYSAPFFACFGEPSR